MRGQIMIEERFKGPPASGNGGYVCGLVARPLGDAAQVNLRRPPPLETPLVLDADGASARLLDAEDVVADGERYDVQETVPAPVTLAEARDGMANFAGFREHPFPGCFVCGPDRAEGDGLHVFPGEVGGRGVVASPWLPHHSLPTHGSHVAPEVVWAVLDCPTSFGFATLEDPPGPSVLARLAARLVSPVEVEQPHVVMGWPISRDGRKSEGGSAIFSEAGELKGFARGLWIELRR